MKKILLLIILLLGTGCSFFDPNFLEPNVNTLEDAQAFIGVPLPTDATDIHYEVGGFTDIFVRLRFTAPADAAIAYLMQIGIALTPALETNATSAGSGPDWWQPERSEARAVGKLDNFEHNRFYNVTVDQTNPTEWIVYLWANSM